MWKVWECICEFTIVIYLQSNTVAVLFAVNYFSASSIQAVLVSGK
jgi:hypothetical protein